MNGETYRTKKVGREADRFACYAGCFLYRIAGWWLAQIVLALVIIALVLSACGTTPHMTNVQPVVWTDELTALAQPSLSDSGRDLENDISCSEPRPEMATICALREAYYLERTVRLELWHMIDQDGTRGECVDVSHATVMDGRYLVTHNHFPVPLTQLLGESGDDAIRASIYRTNGEIVLKDVPPTAFSLVLADEQTAVLDFFEYAGQGLFEAVGVPSAMFARGETIRLAADDELAQIDWDGETAHIDWVHLRQVVREDNTPCLIVANFVGHGASGGGVFWNGYHIGNNWNRVTELDSLEGTVLDQFTVVALNRW